jgi:hypothetical protein
MEIFITSGTHSFTDTDERIDECERNLDNPDAVFIEAPVGSFNRKEQVKLTLFAPLLMIMSYFWIDVVLRISKVFFGDDRKIERYFEDKYAADVIAVDISHFDEIRKNLILWSAANWLAITWPFVPIVPEISPISVAYLSILSFQSVIIFVSYLAGVHSFRNWFMANQMASYEGEYSEACFVTGKQHHKEIADRLSENSSVDVLNKHENHSNL